MSGIGSTSGSGSASPQVYGTNVPPVSFPGIASGIDYNSIIQKYSALTIAQSKPLQDKVTALNAQDAELLKIQNLVSQLQDTFSALSDPANFSASMATSSDTSAVTASGIAGQTATPGAYQILSTQLATATQISNDPAANGTFLTNVPLSQSGSSITPTNGTTMVNGVVQPGKLTINGVTISYDVNSDTFASLQAKINAIPGVTLSAPDATGRVTLTSANGPLTLGSATDTGNILSVLKLDSSPVVQTGTSYAVTGSSAVGGINYGSTLNQNNNAGFATAVTAGQFTINGVKFTVDPTRNNLKNVLDQINNSSAGVLATYDAAHDKVILTAKSTGPQGIALGSSADTSNFLSAVGFLASPTTPGTLSAGATQSVGKAAVVQYLDASGTTRTAYSNANDVTNVVPGIDLKLLKNSSTGFTINVAQDTTNLQASIKKFVTAYNAVMDEINTATQAPVIGSSTSSSTGQQVSGQLSSGGVLFNNQDVLSLRDQLVSIVSGIGNSGSSSYNSLSTIGLTLDSSFTVQTASAGTNATNSQAQTNVSSQTFQGTSGRLADLDVSKLTAAFAANPNAVQQLFTAKNNPIYNLGAYLTSTTGLPTQMKSGIAGTVPTQSLFTSLTSATLDQISSLQQQIQLVTDQANLQANALRAEFAASETRIAQLQSVQSSLGKLTG